MVQFLGIIYFYEKHTSRSSRQTINSKQFFLIEILIFEKNQNTIAFIFVPFREIEIVEEHFLSFIYMIEMNIFYTLSILFCF
jgi:hypothetical protein